VRKEKIAEGCKHLFDDNCVLMSLVVGC